MVLSDRIKKTITIKEEISSNQTDLCEYNRILDESSLALSEKLFAISSWLKYTKEERQKLIVDFVEAYLTQKDYNGLNDDEKSSLIETLSNSSYGFGIIDNLLTKENIKRIFINSNDAIYYSIYNQELIKKAELSFTENQYSTFIEKINRIHPQNSSINTYKIDNLIIRIINEPICSTKVYIEIQPNSEINFNFLEQIGFCSEFHTKFFKNTIARKENIIISTGMIDESEYLNESILKTFTNDNRVILFEASACTKDLEPNIETFNISNLNDNDKKDLCKFANNYTPDYIYINDYNTIFDIQVINNKTNNTAIIMTIPAFSEISAITSLADNIAASYGYTEKQGKSFVGSTFSYIVQLGKINNNPIIKSIHKIYLNKSGSPVLKELIVYKDNKYQYDENELMNIGLPIIEAESANLMNLSFSERSSG